jgi:acyl transferase domain-containing protein
VEAHGTGTALGDPIELQAISAAYRRYTADTEFCGIGSVKTNIGHVDTAAGLAGLIKVALSLEHRELPPTLHYRQPNPRFALRESPFYVVDQRRRPGRRRASGGGQLVRPRRHQCACDPRGGACCATRRHGRRRW